MDLLILAVVAFAGAFVGAYFALRSKRVRLRHDPDLHAVLLTAYSALASQLWKTSREYVKVVLALAEERPAPTELLSAELEFEQLYLANLMLIPADAVKPMLSFMEQCQRLRAEGLGGRSANQVEREMLSTTRRILAKMRRTLRLQERSEDTAAFFPKMDGALGPE